MNFGFACACVLQDAPDGLFFSLKENLQCVLWCALIMWQIFLVFLSWY